MERDANYEALGTFTGGVTSAVRLAKAIEAYGWHLTDHLNEDV